MEKTYTLIAGVNGAGKSTFYRLGDILPKNQKRVNSDEILKENKGDWRNVRDQMDAMKEAVRRKKTYLEKGISFNQETTLSGNGIIRDIQQAKQRGFKVQMYYVGVESADLAVERVANRVKQGGHGIEEDDIKRRYESSLKNLRNAIGLCDKVYIYDNTVEFKQVAIFEDGKMLDNTIEKCGWFDRMFGETEPGKGTMDMESWRNVVSNIPVMNSSLNPQQEHSTDVKLPDERK